MDILKSVLKGFIAGIIGCGIFYGIYSLVKKVTNKESEEL